MTPERAAAIFRALLETPAHELSHFPRRHGLEGSPTPQELAQAREILQALDVALSSDPGPNWERIATAWSAMRARHGELQLDASRPAWVGRVPPKPTLGDPAPGTHAHQAREEQRQRFVPTPQVGQAYATPPQPSYPQQPSQPVKPWGPPAYQAAPAPSHPGPPQGYPGSHAPQAQGYPGSHAPQAGYGQPYAQAYPQPSYPQQPHAQAPPQPSPQAPSRRPPPPPQRQGSGAASPVETSVATYAAFCAACAARPDRTATTLAEYGLAGPEARARLDDDWQDRFDDDPSLHQQWEQLFHKFRSQLG